MYIYLYIFIYIYIYSYTYIYKYVYIYIDMYRCIYACAYIQISKDCFKRFALKLYEVNHIFIIFITIIFLTYNRYNIFVHISCIATSELFREKRKWFRIIFPFFMKYVTKGFVSEMEAGERLAEVCIFICMYLYFYMYVFLCLCIYIYIYICIYIYIYLNIQIYLYV
jgi:hypothetical protein